VGVRAAVVAAEEVEAAAVVALRRHLRRLHLLRRRLRRRHRLSAPRSCISRISTADRRLAV